MKLPPELQRWNDRGGFFSFGDHQIFFIDTKPGDSTPNQTLLVLHGFPESSFSYHKVIEPLSARFDRVVLVDFLGFGLSDKPKKHNYSLMEQADLLTQLWAKIGVTGGHLLAHDMGDSVATELLARHNDETLPSFLEGFCSITLTNGNMVMERAKLRFMQVLLQKPGLGAVLSRLTNFKIFRQQVLSASGTAGLSDRDVALMWANIQYNHGTRVTHRLIRYLGERKIHQNCRWLPALQRTEVPVHLCWGLQDSVAPESVAQHLKDKVCPQATLTWLENAGHFCQQEAPDDWLNAITTFYNNL